MNGIPENNPIFEELAATKKKLEDIRSLLSSILPEHVPGPFICGRGGEDDDNGLPEYIYVCPSYGADVQCTKTYKRVDGIEWKP